jgi:hypothetical protein
MSRPSLKDSLKKMLTGSISTAPAYVITSAANALTSRVPLSPINTEEQLAMPRMTELARA